MREAEFQVHDVVKVAGMTERFNIRFIEDDYAVCRMENGVLPLVARLADLKHVNKVCIDCKRPIQGREYFGRCGFCEHDAHGR